MTYAQDVLSLDPVAYWRLGEAAGTQAVDASGNGHHGTYFNSPALGVAGALTGDADTAATFDPTSPADGMRVSAASAAALGFAGTAPFSAAFWANYTTLGQFRRFLHFGQVSLGWHVMEASTGLRFGRVDDGGTDQVIDATIRTGWHMWVGTYDGTDLRFYADGVLVAGPTASSRSLPAATVGGIGNQGNGHWAGSGDEPAIFDRVLTAAEIEWLYERGIEGQKNLPAHAVVTVSESAPGFDCWLARGRIARKDVARGSMVMGAARQWQVTAEDANRDLSGLALTAAWERPAETDVDRVNALLAAFCNGSPRPSTVIQSDLVASSPTTAMPAKTYPAGTELPEIIGDCMTTAGKVYGVVIHHEPGVGSHLCLLYIGEGDLTTYASTLTITDEDPDLLTEFPPIWDQGPATIEEGQDLVSGLVSRYSVKDAEDAMTEASVFVEDAADVASYDYWVLPFADAESESAAQATARATAVRGTRSKEALTHSVTIMLPATQVDLLCAGMAITLRSRAAMGGQYGGTTQTRRIAQLKWEQIAPEVGAQPATYLAHMQLDRPLQLLRPAAGIGSPAFRALAVGADVAQYLTDLSVAGANMVPNSSFESASTSGWTTGAGWTFGHDPVSPEEPFAGTKLGRGEAAASDLGILETPLVAVARDDDWWISVWSFMRAYTSGTGRISLREYDAADAFLQETVIVDVTAAETAWTRHSIHAGPDDARGRHAFHASTTQVSLRLDGIGVGTFTWDVDGVQVERGKLLTAYAPSPQELVDGQITTTQMADLAITLAKLANDSVDSAKLVAAAVTEVKLATGAITETKVSDGAITTPKLVALAVTAEKIAALAVIADKIAAGAITTEKLSALAVTADKIAALAITAAKLAAGSVETDKLAANAVVAGKIAAAAITADKIAAAAITADKIAVGAVTPGKFTTGERVGNLVRNGGFEDVTGVTLETIGGGLPPGWADALGDYYTTASGAYAGQHHFWFTYGTGVAGQVECERFPVRGNGRYRARCVMRGDAGNPAGTAGRIWIQWYDADGDFISEVFQAETVGTGSWRWVELSGVAPAAAVTGAVFLTSHWSGATGQYVGFDAVEAYPADDDIDHAGGGVLITSQGITVTNAGGTVIIDGTSNMFKIAATGTLSIPAHDGSGTPAAATVDLATGLTFNPASLLYLLTDYARTLPYAVFAHADGTWLDEFFGGAKVVNTNQTQVHGAQRSRRVGGIAGRSYRYYVLKEAAL